MGVIEYRIQEMGNDYEYEYTRILQNLTSNIALRMQNMKERKTERKRQRDKERKALWPLGTQRIRVRVRPTSSVGVTVSF